MLISESFDTYISDHIAFIGQSGKTEESYIATKKMMIARFGDIPITALGFRDIRDWKLFLDKGRSPNTVRNYIVCLRVVLRFLSLRGVQVINPDTVPVPKRKHTETDYLTEDEFGSLLAAVSRTTRGYCVGNRLRNIAILKTLYATGLRNAELCSLNRSTIKDNTFTVVGKGNKPRICFISKDAVEAIDDYLKCRKDNNEALFVSKTGQRITPDGVRRIFSFIRKSYSEFKGVHPHTIRHSYATKLLKRRVDIRYVKEFMGHESLDTTAHYTHIVNEDLKNIYLDAIGY